MTPCIIPLAADRDLDHPVLALSLVAQDLLDRLGIDRISLRPDLPKRGGRLGVLGTDLLDGVPDGLDSGGELFRLALAANVHEIDLRLVIKEVIVQSRDFQPMGESGVDRWRHLVLEDHRVAHDHRPVRCGGEGCPRAQACERLERNAIDLDLDVIARPADADHAVGRHCRLRARGGADLDGIEAFFRRRSGGAS